MMIYQFRKKKKLTWLIPKLPFTPKCFFQTTHLSPFLLFPSSLPPSLFHFLLLPSLTLSLLFWISKASAILSIPQNNLSMVNHNILRKYKGNIITSMVNSAKQLKYSARGTPSWSLYGGYRPFPSEK